MTDKKESRGEVGNTPNPEISSKSTMKKSLYEESVADAVRSIQKYMADPNFDPTAPPVQKRTLNSLSPGAQAKSIELIVEARRAVDNCMNVFENISSVAPPQMPEIRLTNDNSVIGRRVETGEENKASKSTEQPEGSISTQAQTTQEVQTPNQILPQQRDQLVDLNAVISGFKESNSNLAAVEKYQENTLKCQDILKMQGIQNDLLFRPIIPITDYVGVNVEPPIDVLPPEWINLLNSISCSLGVPVEALISAFLAAIFTAICGKFKIEVRNDYFEACTEYFIVVMDSGSKKSAIVLKFRIPLDKFIKQLQDEYDKKTPNKKILMKLYDKAEKKLINKFANKVHGKDKDEFDLCVNEFKIELEQLKLKLTDGNSRPNLFNDSPTMKKLGENMMDQKEFISIIDAEGGILKNSVSNKVDTILLKSFTMEGFGRETSNNGSVIMKHPCLVICSYMQKSVAFNLYSKEGLKDDGLLPRFLPLFCSSPPIIHDTIPQDIDHDLMEMYERKVSSILEYCWDKRMVNGEIDILKMTDEARQKYFYFSQTINARINEGKYNNCNAFASKLAGHAVRLAGAVHFLEHDKPWEEPIGASAMKAGIAWAEFYAKHALFAFDKKQNDSVVYATKINEWAKNHLKENFEQRDAQRGIHGSKIDQIEAGLDLLIKNNYVARHRNPKGKMVYIVNPNVFSLV